MTRRLPTSTKLFGKILARYLAIAALMAVWTGTSV